MVGLHCHSLAIPLKILRGLVNRSKVYGGGVNGNGCCCCCKGGGGGGGGGGGDNDWSSPVVVQGRHGEDPGSRGEEVEEVDAVVEGEEVKGCGAVGTP